MKKPTPKRPAKIKTKKTTLMTI